MLLCAWARPPAAAQDLRFEYLFTIGSAHGVNPAQKLSGPLAKLVFGAPERISPLIAPAAVTVDRDDRIWITDRAGATVHMFDLLEARYKLLRGAPKTAFQCPAGIDSDSLGRIYVADPCSARIFVFDPEGEFLRFLGGNRLKMRVKQPTALVVSRDLKSIYVTDPPRQKVVVLNQEGETIREWGGLGGPGELRTPTALALDYDRIYVLDSARHRVQAFSPGGAHLESRVWDQIREPSAFAFDPEGRFFFVGDPRFEVVQVFNEHGFSVAAFGQSGSGDGEMRTPSNIYVDFKRRIYVVDTSNAKVLVFRETDSKPILPLPSGKTGATR